MIFIGTLNNVYAHRYSLSPRFLTLSRFDFLSYSTNLTLHLHSENSIPVVFTIVLGEVLGILLMDSLPLTLRAASSSLSSLRSDSVKNVF